MTGQRIYEGRLNTKFWATVELDTDMVLFSDNQQVLVTITDKKYYAYFGQGWKVLRQHLLPGRRGRKSICSIF